jgi:hypothetical protein
MDARYTGIFPRTLKEEREQLRQYHAARQAASQRKQLAQAYLAQAFAPGAPQQYRCERCGI